MSSAVKQAVIWYLTRVPSNMDVLKPAIDKLSEEELRALSQVLMHYDTKLTHLKRKVQRGY